MHFNTYGFNAALLAAAIANLAEDTEPAQHECLLGEHRVTRPALTGDQPAELREWGGRLWAVFADPSTPGKVEAINGLLAEAAARPYISTHDGQPPHLHYADEQDDVLTRVRAVTAGGVAMVLTEAGPHRLGLCAAPGCRVVFVDTSRNGRRSYCTPTCATRVNVAEHRRRSKQ